MFMKKFGEKSSDEKDKTGQISTDIMNFYDAQLYPFTLKLSKGKGEIKCNARSFDQVDPNPGHTKQCFCAKKDTVQSDIVKGIQKFWSSKNDQVKLEQTHIKVLS